MRDTITYEHNRWQLDITYMIHLLSQLEEETYSSIGI